MVIISFPAWFFGRCVFLDNWSALDGVACSPVPLLSVHAWTLYVVALIVSGLCYVALYRLSVRHG